jgi:rubrerythrin
VYALRAKGIPFLMAHEEERRPVTDHERGETDEILWVCTVCDYSMEGELPEECPECGANKSEFDEVPKPGF